MKKSLILAALPLILSQPAWTHSSTQSRRGSSAEISGPSSGQLIDRLARQVDQDARNGALSLAEAKHLRSEVVELRRLQRRHGRLGASDRTDLARRTEALRHQLLAAEQQRHGQPTTVARRKRYPGEEPIFSNNDRMARAGNHVDTGIDNSRFDRLGRLDRGFTDRTAGSTDYQYRDRDDGPHGNDLRGPPPPKHDEGD